jgi:hypothetical protein
VDDETRDEQLDDEQEESEVEGHMLYKWRDSEAPDDESGRGAYLK